MAGSERIERPQLASKTSGLPLTELPIGVTGGIRTHVGLVHSQPPETRLGYGHIWCLESGSSRPLRLFRPSLIRLSYPGELGGPPGN